jgi:LuxR family maltose regulon positive regulatory protein
MNIPITLTKIILPRRPASLLTRERLLNLLYDLLDYRLILIAAPAGYGKTSLLVDLAHGVEMPVCWCSLDALDQDPQRFLAHFIAAIAQRFPDFGKQSSALQGDALGGLDVGRLASLIVNDAYEHIQEHFVLILDDYHLVSDSHVINRFISHFVQRMDENCHLFLSSRTLLNLPDLPLMVARSQVGGLEFKDLAFRTDEIQALLLQNYRMTMPATEAEKLARETEGWITGLLLSAQTMWQGMADRVRLARASGVGLYDYLAQQVLDQQPAAVRDFLLCTSPMEEFDAGLCEAVLGADEDWPHLIETVLRSNLFVLPVDNGGTWLRYHHLFRDFLQTRLAQERPEEHARVLWRLAAVYAEREEWDKARDACCRLGDVVATADLVEQAGSSLVKCSRWAVLAEWIDALPAQLLTSRPGLISLRGFAAVELGEAERGLSLLNQAEAAFRAAGDQSGLARTLVRRATDHRLAGNYRASLADADEALTLSGEDERWRAIRAEALRTKGLSLLMMGQLIEAIEWLAQSLAAYNALQDKQNVALISMDLGLACMNTGHCDQALTHYTCALDYWQEANNVVQQSNLLNNLGVLHHLRGNYEQARATLEEALACARRSGCGRIEVYALCGIGDLYAELDAPDAALDAYRQAREMARRIGELFLLLYLDLAEAALARSGGQLAQARDLLASAGRLAQASGSSFEQGLWRLEAGRLALAEGDARGAATCLEEAAHRFDEGGQRIEAARAYLYLAAACRAKEDEKAALAHLGRAFDLVSELESQHALVVAGREARLLLEASQGDPALGCQASRLLQQITQFERDLPTLRRRMRQQASTVPFAPPRLAFRALGNVQVWVGEKPVTGADWEAQAARDLLFCLLAHPDGLTKETIGVIFWPESSQARLKVHFKKTLYRLRRVLGQDMVVFDQGRYVFNRALDYEYDVENFLGKLAQARVATDPAARAAACRAAIDLYKGHYLPDVDGEWVVPERERLWQAYVQAVLELAELCLETSKYETVLEYCRRVLAQDACLEEAHCLAMRAYAATGNQAALARQFERCRQAMQEELGIPLSPQTEALHERLMRR